MLPYDSTKTCVGNEAAGETHAIQRCDRDDAYARCQERLQKRRTGSTTVPMSNGRLHVSTNAKNTQPQQESYSPVLNQRTPTYLERNMIERSFLCFALLLLLPNFSMSSKIDEGRNLVRALFRVK
jgi:hypothetical protein